MYEPFHSQVKSVSMLSMLVLVRSPPQVAAATVPIARNATSAFGVACEQEIGVFVGEKVRHISGGNLNLQNNRTVASRNHTFLTFSLLTFGSDICLLTFTVYF